MITDAERQKLVLEMQALIEELSKGASRLKEIQDTLLQSVDAPQPATTATPEKKPMPKYFGPDPNFQAPNVPTPEKRTLDDHTLTWGPVSKKF